MLVVINLMVSNMSMSSLSTSSDTGRKEEGIRLLISAMDSETLMFSDIRFVIASMTDD